MEPSRIGIALLLLALQTQPAFACGYCVEDRIAATYDFAIVSRAIDQQHKVAFFAIEGGMAARGMSSEAIARVLEGTRGVDRNSVRVSVDSESLSFAFDPSRAPLGPILVAAGAKLAVKGLSLAPLRVLDANSYTKPASKAR